MVMEIVDTADDNCKNVSAENLYIHSADKVNEETLDVQSPSFCKNFFQKARIEIVQADDLNMEFDLIGMAAPFVNAFRRVLLAEVPSMAVDKVLVYNNTSIVQDEVLSHRLGLIPLKADPRKFSYKKCEDDEIANADDTLEFQLKILYSKNESNLTKSKCKEKSNTRYENVLTKHIKWVPIGDQITKFKENCVGPVNDDILLAKLRPGHELDLKLFATKGIGKDHAKFQPVATVSYRLLPKISLNSDVENEKAQKLKMCFSANVIDIEKIGDKMKARVRNARMDSCSRNVYKYDDLKECVNLSRVPDHYIFSIESIGALSPDILFLEAVRVLQNKCEHLLSHLGQNGYASFS